ncbi:MAG: UDP-N-acetylmuramoyl-L-alanine--D-glutamate ligase [Saccharofermentanales bacterium]
MNKKLNEFKDFLKGKKVAVLGVGISNKPLIQYIYGFGPDITAFDMAEDNDPFILKTKMELINQDISINWVCGENYLEQLHGFDIIFKTPKIRVDLPELIRERNAGTIVTSEMEVFLECCPCKVIAVTGSDGKTTTTTMISMFLQEEGYTVYVGGNIGTPLLNVIDKIKDTDYAVLELSSFQLHSMRKSPDVAVITNISPNHLDIHKDYTEYTDAKKNIFLYQSFMGKLILNYKNYLSKEFNEEARGEVIWFNKPDENGYYYDSKNLYFSPGQSIPRNQIVLVGTHNLENYSAAIAAVRPLVSDSSILNVVKKFVGVEHRLEFVREINGVSYYNSSIDSNPTRTKATLKTFADAGKRVVIITGGKDKNSDYSGIGKAMLSVSNKIILCGQNSKLIRDNLEKELLLEKYDKENVTIIEVPTYKEAVQKAKELAIEGESIVLTPAGTSFDQFRNFEERGNTFKILIMSL